MNVYFFTCENRNLAKVEKISCFSYSGKIPKVGDWCGVNWSGKYPSIHWGVDLTGCGNWGVFEVTETAVYLW